MVNIYIHFPIQWFHGAISIVTWYEVRFVGTSKYCLPMNNLHAHAVNSGVNSGHGLRSCLRVASPNIWSKRRLQSCLGLFPALWLVIVIRLGICSQIAKVMGPTWVPPGSWLYYCNTPERQHTRSLFTLLNIIHVMHSLISVRIVSLIAPIPVK